MHRRAKEEHIGNRWKMFAILVLFIVFVAFFIWFFQVRMLNYFYQETKFRELENTSDAISGVLDDTDKLKDTVGEYAEDFFLDIWVFEIREDTALPIINVNGSGSTMQPFLVRRFPALYDKAIENGGTYIAIVPMEHFKESLDLRILADNSGEPDSYPIYTAKVGTISTIYVSVYESGGKSYAVIQSADLTPVQTVAKTLRNQFLWIGIFLIFLALIMTAIMSKVITKPIVRMNAAAKELAKGHYGVEFHGKGYREISELAQTLNYASRELSKTDALQKELISNVSHDLRTPLTMIKGYSEVMRDIPGENNPENVQVIIDETERLSRLVNDMLDISRIQAGTRKPQYEAFSLTETVRSTMARYEKLTMQEGYRISFSADRDVSVYADRGMILQVVYNLINNAIHYTGEDKQVSVFQLVKGDTVRISVTDTGEGISEEEIPLIWDRYYKVDKVHKRAEIGTGLGLSIVKGVLELHGASYGVESTPGVGSTFWFELKILPDDRGDGGRDLTGEENDKRSDG